MLENLITAIAIGTLIASGAIVSIGGLVILVWVSNLYNGSQDKLKVSFGYFLAIGIFVASLAYLLIK